MFKDTDLAGWFISNNLSENLRTFIPRVVLAQEPEQSSSDSNIFFSIVVHIVISNLKSISK